VLQITNVVIRYQEIRQWIISKDFCATKQGKDNEVARNCMYERWQNRIEFISGSQIHLVKD